MESAFIQSSGCTVLKTAGSSLRSTNGNPTPTGSIALGCVHRTKCLPCTTQSTPGCGSDKRRSARTRMSTQTEGQLYRVRRCQGRVVFSRKLENLHPSLDSEMGLPPHCPECNLSLTPVHKNRLRTSAAMRAVSAPEASITRISTSASEIKGSPSKKNPLPKR